MEHVGGKDDVGVVQDNYDEDTGGREGNRGETENSQTDKMVERFLSVSPCHNNESSITQKWDKNLVFLLIVQEMLMVGEKRCPYCRGVLIYTRVPLYYIRAHVLVASLAGLCRLRVTVAHTPSPYTRYPSDPNRM